MTETVSFEVKPTLTGKLVLLRPVQEADAAGLAGLELEALRLTGTHKTHSMDALRAWYGSRAEHADRLDLSIIERSTGTWLGEVVLNDLDEFNRSCGFRIALAARANFGRGFGSEATRLVLGHAFDTVGLHRVELEVYRFNPRARQVYEKVGFVHEGTKRQALCWGGEWIDADLMAMLASEWRHD
ncbi:MAG: GNAT family N-acetyltransferase [Acidimicrobiales bacterium]